MSESGVEDARFQLGGSFAQLYSVVKDPDEAA